MGGAASAQTSVQANGSQICTEILQSVDAVFAHLAVPRGESLGVPAERLGDAMRILGISSQVEKSLDQLGRPTHLDEKTFRDFSQEELRKYFSRVQAVVDYLKQYDQGTKGALSREELQEAIRGSGLSIASVKQLEVPSNDGHLFDIVELSKNFVELGHFLQGTEASGVARMSSACEEENASAYESYDLKNPLELARFLQEADVRLVRLEYLVYLLLSKRPLPRRQEAQEENFTKDGEIRSALVSHEEVQRWSHGSQAALICSISHAWETREHPDPCRHQLQHVVNHCGLYGAAFEADVWIFYDYTSLFQFERVEKSHEVSFRKAMANMHLLYAHEYSLTFRIQNLTRKDVWNEMMQKDELVPVWDIEAKGLEKKPLKALVANFSPYGERGWCTAEVEWSSLRSVNAQFQRIDEAPSDDSFLSARVPTTPENFQQRMEQAVFTHRSDASAVIHLQQKIFTQKVTDCEDLVLEGLPATEMLALARALPKYSKLKTLSISCFQCCEAEATAVAEAVSGCAVEQLHISCGLDESSSLMVKALESSRMTSLTSMTLSSSRIDADQAEALANVLANLPRLSQLDLSRNELGPEGTQVLSAALQGTSLRDIALADNSIYDEGAEALAKVFKTKSLRDIDLSWNYIGIDGVQALCEALQGKSSLRDIKLKANCMASSATKGAQALANVLKANPSLRDMDLSSTEIGDPGIQALCEALKDKSSLRDIRLSCNQIGQRGAKALSKVLTAKPCLRDVDLSSNSIGQQGAEALIEVVKVKESTLRKMDLSCNAIGPEMLQAVEEAMKRSSSGESRKVCSKPFEVPVRLKALAEALTTNTSVTRICCNDSSIGVDGAKALADALRANSSVAGIELLSSKIGPDGAKALADALRTNTAITQIRFYENNIGPDGAKALAEALKANSSIAHIELLSNNIGPDGAKALAAALDHVTRIDLRQNCIGSDGAKAVAEALKANVSVTDIALGGNEIGPDGAKAVAEALKENASVTDIDFGGNKIGPDGAKVLAEALTTNRSITKICLSYSWIGPDGAKALAEALKANSSVRDIDLKHNDIGDGMKAVAEALADNASITAIDLSFTEVDDDGAEALAEALKANASVAKMKLFGNNIGNAGAKALAEALTANTSIAEINLQCNPISDFKALEEVVEQKSSNFEMRW